MNTFIKCCHRHVKALSVRLSILSLIGMSNFSAWASNHQSGPLIPFNSKAEITEVYAPALFLEEISTGFNEMVHLQKGDRFLINLGALKQSFTGLSDYQYNAQTESSQLETVIFSYVITSENGESYSETKSLDVRSSNLNSIVMVPDSSSSGRFDVYFNFIPFDNDLEKKDLTSLTNDSKQSIKLATLKPNDNLDLDISISSPHYNISNHVHIGANGEQISNMKMTKDSGSPAFFYQLPVYLDKENYKSALAEIGETVPSSILLDRSIQTISGASYTEASVTFPLTELSTYEMVTITYGNDQGDSFEEGMESGESTISFDETRTETDSGDNPIEQDGTDPIPANNSDIQALIKTVQNIAALGRICDEYKCPKLDCEKARELFQSLHNAQIYLRAMTYYLEIDLKVKQQHFTNLMQQEILTGENIYNVRMALAYQEFLHNFGSALLDIASVYSYVKQTAKEISKGQFSGDGTSLSNFLDKIDDAYEAIRDLTDGVKTLGSSGGLSENDLNTHKSTLTNIKSAVKEAAKTGKDWRKNLSDIMQGKKYGENKADLSKIRENIGQIIGRYLEVYSASLIKERIERLNDLLEDVSPEARARAEAYLAKQKVLIRLIKAEEAYELLIQTKAAIRPCLEKICGKMDLNNNIVFDIERAGFNFGSNLNLQISNHGSALLYFNQKIPKSAQAIGVPLEVKDDCPKVSEDSYMMDTDADFNFRIDNDVQNYGEKSDSITTESIDKLQTPGNQSQVKTVDQTLSSVKPINLNEPSVQAISPSEDIIDSNELIQPKNSDQNSIVPFLSQ